MSTPQPPRPAPPPGFDSWLDAACEGMVIYGGDPVKDHALRERAALRKDLETTKGLLKQQQDNVLALMQERDELRKVVDAAARYCDAWQSFEDYTGDDETRISQLWEAYMASDGAVFEVVARHRAAAQKESGT